MGGHAMTGGRVTDLLVGGAQVLGVTLTAPLGRRRYNRWGATDAEVAAAIPGDGLVTRPVLGYTRAITIEAPPERVWPWLVQMGQGRGGLYSFDGLENLVGCDIHSAEQVLPDLQRLAVGDLIRLGPAGYPCFAVAQVEARAALVLVGADPRPPHLAATPDSPGGIATWQWQLQPTSGARGTRLVTRQRLSYPSRTWLAVMWHVVEPVGFVMERRMLRGIKQRAERDRRSSPPGDRRRRPHREGKPRWSRHSRPTPLASRSTTPTGWTGPPRSSASS
jgi:hypothetical protein